MSDDMKNFGTGSKTEDDTCNYAEDRALIKDLQARYMFAMDFGDLDLYVSTFTEDGILDIIGGQWQGRDAIRQVVANMPKVVDEPFDMTRRPATGRHIITNIVIKVDGNKAWGRAYWFRLLNNNPQRSAMLDSYGHYEDDMVKVDGKWLFSKRRIFNEQYDSWASTGVNPCW